MNRVATVYPGSIREAMAQWPTGIAVVTTADREGWWWGCAADSFCPVSLRPPLVSVGIDRESPCRPALVSSDVFAVHVLGAGQEDLARRFATGARDTFDDLAVECGLEDVPLLCDVTVRMECQLTTVVPAGDHVMLIGEVRRLRTCPGDPLVYLRRHFRRLSRFDSIAA